MVKFVSQLKWLKRGWPVASKRIGTLDLINHLISHYINPPVEGVRCSSLNKRKAKNRISNSKIL